MPPHPLNNDKQSTRARSYVERADQRSTTQIGKNDSAVSRPREAGKIEQDVHPQQRLRRQRVPISTSDAGSTSSGVNASYNGAMPMGGMGMGMGMGMPMGYGMGMGMGMGYGGMHGMMGGGFMSGPMSMIYSVNYFIAMMGQLTAMFGMIVQAIGPLYEMARDSLIKMEKSIRQSEIRRWVQRKAAKSPVLRCLLVLASMLAASQAVRLLRYLIELRMRRSAPSITNGVETVADSGSAVAAMI